MLYEEDRSMTAIRRINEMQRRIDTLTACLVMVAGLVGWLVWSWVEKFGW